MNRQNPDTIIAQYVQRFDELNLHKTIGEQEQLDEKTQYIVNADESGYSKQSIGNFRESTFRTKTGIELLNSIYGS